MINLMVSSLRHRRVTSGVFESLLHTKGAVWGAVEKRAVNVGMFDVIWAMDGVRTDVMNGSIEALQVDHPNFRQLGRRDLA